MAEQTPAFDYGTAIPRQRIYQARSVPGVVRAEGLFMGWNVWQRTDGRRVNVALIGLDRSLQGGPWELAAGEIASVRKPETVLVDEMFRASLQVDGVGSEAEMFGQKARVGGITSGVRTFTASPFIFTSLESAIAYDKRYRPDEVTYVMARCAPGSNPEAVASALRAAVPHVEVLTTSQFSIRSMRYWMLETGVGITVVLTAILGLAVGSIILSQTLFAVTQEFLPNYATLLAIGFSLRTIRKVVLGQSLMIGVPGVLLGSGMFAAAAVVSAPTQIPLETTPMIFCSLMLVALIACVLVGGLSARMLQRVDPVSVFRQ
jgi:putative ABC transport system permease protein